MTKGRLPTGAMWWSAVPVVLAGILGVAIGWSPAPGWLPSLVVVVAVVVGVLRPAGTPVWASALTVLLFSATAVGTATGEHRLESAALSVPAALVHAAAVALPVGLVELARRRRRHREQGWALARALAREERARTESALAKERAAMAGEIHDHLGHRLTLVTVQLGKLSLAPELPPESRAAVEEARRGVAEAAAELGTTVQLLKAGGQRTLAPADRPLADIADTARSAGLVVDSYLPAVLDRELASHAHAALARVLSEALTNAAKHAPGQAVRIDGGVVDGMAVLTVTNARGRSSDDAAGSSGHGLPSLRHRLALLGGMLEVEYGEDHVLRAAVPIDAVPEGETGDGAEQVTSSERAADEEARKAGRLTWAVPAVLAASAMLITVVAYLYLTVSSDLPPEQFARIEVGMSRDEAASLLPAVEMIEAPRQALPEPDRASCRYHEESISLFAREDVFRICFVDGVVVSTDTISAPEGAP
ncbi:sensor histidine kinase [Ornithinicoccus halotolerans]|uniref:sensor histidine kinase n=1 Tax=Ornithinicoccus halotolerans TaxID=1748220 RepID=UPI001885EF89|nr:histidine kinase [Ornithinicoccus halotolerans]